MKVCLLADAESPHTRRLARGLARRGAEVRVLTHRPAEIPGVRVERFAVPPPGLGNPFRWSVRLARYLDREVRAHDVVNMHFLADWGLTAELIAQGCFIATPWGSDIVPPPGEGEATQELTTTRRMLIREATMVSTCSDSLARAVAEFAGVSAGDIRRTPFGVDLRRFRRRRNANAVSGRPTVGFYKGFRPVYGPTWLLQAIPMVRRAVPDCQFLLAGSGAELAKCHEMALRLGVQDAIEWLPPLRHEQVPAFLSRCHLTVIPSEQESFGVAALESSAMETPVVASNVGGLPEVVHDDVTGRLVPVRSAESLAHGIIRLLADEPLRRQLGSVGRAFVEEHFDNERCLDRWVALYEDAVAARFGVHAASDVSVKDTAELVGV